MASAQGPDQDFDSGSNPFSARLFDEAISKIG
jgi:hypothetical protein